MEEINEGTKYERTDMTVEFPTGFLAIVNWIMPRWLWICDL